MLIRREAPADAASIRAVHTAAFRSGPEASPETADLPAGRFESPATTPVEADLVDALRADPGWLPALSLVALVAADGTADEPVTGRAVTGHVVCTRGTVGGHPALGLGPVGVLPAYQGRGVGSALMHAVLATAEALDESVVVLLGHADYYPRFGFRPAAEYGITPPVATWAGPHFQARTLTAYRPEIRGEFRYAAPFERL